jgi:hypothetical protein
LHELALVQAAQRLPAAPGRHTPTPLTNWHDSPVPQELGTSASHSARHLVWGEPTHARPCAQPAMPPPTLPQASPSVATSSAQAQAPPPVLSVRHEAQVPGLAGLQSAWQRPAMQTSPSAQALVAEQSWQSPGPPAGARHALSPLVSDWQVSGLVQPAFAQPVHWVCPLPVMQQRRHQARPVPSPTQVLHEAQKVEISQRSPAVPRGRHVPPVQV